MDSPKAQDLNTVVPANKMAPYYSTGKPLHYHSCDSVFVFQYYNKSM